MKDEGMMGKEQEGSGSKVDRDQLSEIIDQFTRQAAPFAALLARSNEESTRLLIQLARLGQQDSVLDVACGPGLLSCALAPHVRQVTGIDLVPAMIEKARRAQQEQRLSNLDWKIGNILPLPFATGGFSAAVCRYAFHHFLQPAAVLKEMIRVTEPKGRVVIIDVFTASAAQSDAYDEVERLKDPSHVRTLPLAELRDMVKAAGLVDVKAEFYRIEMKLEDNLKASFPKQPGDLDKIREALNRDIGQDRIGMGACRKGEDVCLRYPIVAILGHKP